MSTTTANLGLIKPEKSDNYSVDVMGNNMDIIDAMVTPKTETDAVAQRVTTIEEVVSNGNVTANVITANQFVGDISGTAAGLNRVVNVSPSNVKINNGSETMITLLSYVPGVKYSGTISGQLYRGGTTNVGRIRTSILKNGVWTTNEYSLSAGGTEPFTLTLDNIDMLWIYQTNGSVGTTAGTFVYLPLFT